MKQFQLLSAGNWPVGTRYSCLNQQVFKNLIVFYSQSGTGEMPTLLLLSWAEVSNLLKVLFEVLFFFDTCFYLFIFWHLLICLKRTILGCFLIKEILNKIYKISFIDITYILLQLTHLKYTIQQFLAYLKSCAAISAV